MPSPRAVVFGALTFVLGASAASAFDPLVKHAWVDKKDGWSLHFTHDKKDGDHAYHGAWKGKIRARHAAGSYQLHLEKGNHAGELKLYANGAEVAKGKVQFSDGDHHLKFDGMHFHRKK